MAVQLYNRVRASITRAKSSSSVRAEDTTCLVQLPRRPATAEPIVNTAAACPPCRHPETWAESTTDHALEPRDGDATASRRRSGAEAQQDATSPGKPKALPFQKLRTSILEYRKKHFPALSRDEALGSLSALPDVPGPEDVLPSKSLALKCLQWNSLWCRWIT